MILSPFFTNATYIGCILLYIISVIYTYGKLNYILNYKNPVIDVLEWNNNRNKCVLVALFLSYGAALYLWCNFCISMNGEPLLRFTIYRAKEDPLYHQLVEETPNSFWEGNQDINSKIKRKWGQL